MTEEVLIQSFHGEDLPGTLRKRMTVPDGYLALLDQSGELVGQRGPGEYRLGNWPRAAPDVVLLPQVPFDLRPRIQSLRSGDKQDIDLVWPLTVQIADPARFYMGWLSPAPDPTTALQGLEDHLAGLLWEKAQNEVAQYALADLRDEEQIQSSLARAMRQVLAALLDDAGLKLVGSQRPQPRTLDDERVTFEAMNQAARAARDARFEAVFERLEDKEMLAHRLAEWSAERGAGPPDASLVDLLWQVVESGPEEAAVRAQQAAEALDREVAALRLTLQGERTENERRFRQLTARLEGAEEALLETKKATGDPAGVLRKLLFILRIVGSSLTLAGIVITLYMPQLVDEYQRLQFVALIVTAATAVLTLISDLFLRRRTRQVREQAIEAKRRESRASLEQRREADRLVRARVEAGLKQVADNLEAAWKKGYSQGGAPRDLAVELREVARQAGRLGEQEVRVANYHAGRYLAQNNLTDGHLAAVLDLDEDLLGRSHTLAQSAESLYEQVNAGEVEPARVALRGLENGLNALRNRFTERGAYLMNPSGRMD